MRRPDDEAALHRWEQVRLPLLGVLAAARAPLTVAELASFAGVPTAEVRTFVEDAARAFLSHGDGPPDAPSDAPSSALSDAPSSALSDALSDAPRYALRHQSLRDLLTGTAVAGQPDLAGLAPVFAAQTGLAHQRITAALIPPGSPAERGWDGVSEYARHHLAAPAAACDALDGLACDPGFLLATDSVSFLAQRAALRTQGGKRALAAFELSLGDWDASAGAERMTRLAACASRMQATALFTASAQRCADEWPVSWAAWAGEGYRQLTGHGDWVFAVANGQFGDGDGRRDVLVSGSSDGTVRIWDSVTGGSIAGPLNGHDHAVYAVATGWTGNRDVIISDDAKGTVLLDEYRLQ